MCERLIFNIGFVYFVQDGSVHFDLVTHTDKTTLKCDKEFDGKGVGAQREKEKRGGEDG